MLPLQWTRRRRAPGTPLTGHAVSNRLEVSVRASPTKFLDRRGARGLRTARFGGCHRERRSSAPRQLQRAPMALMRRRRLLARSRRSSPVGRPRRLGDLSAPRPSPREGDLHEGHFRHTSVPRNCNLSHGNRSRSGSATGTSAAGTSAAGPQLAHVSHRSLTPAVLSALHLSPGRPEARRAKVMFLGHGITVWGRPCSPVGALNSPAGGQARECLSCEARARPAGRCQLGSAGSVRARRAPRSGTSEKVRGTFRNIRDCSRTISNIRERSTIFVVEHCRRSGSHARSHGSCSAGANIREHWSEDPLPGLWRRSSNGVKTLSSIAHEVRVDTPMAGGETTHGCAIEGGC